MKALQLKEEGKTLDEIGTWLEEHKEDFCVFFTVDDLNHLHRGGRISKTTAIIGSMINIKPILTVNPEGQLVSHSSARGRKKSLHTIFNNMIDTLGKYTDTPDPICIVHGDCLEDAEYLKSLVIEKLPAKQVIINFVSPSIGAHSGPGALGICYMGEKK